MRKGFKFIKPEDVVTHVYDSVSATIPDQSLTLREMMMQFAYIGEERLSEIVNKGWLGDEDDESVLGVDVGALDFAEVHDRLLEQMAEFKPVRSVHAPVVATPEDVPEDTPEDVPAEK